MTVLGIETAGPQRNEPPHTVMNAVDTATQVFPKRSQVHEDSFYVWHENYCDPNVLVSNTKLMLYRVWTTESKAIKKFCQCLMPQ
jgi:hypothetical protein